MRRISSLAPSLLICLCVALVAAPAAAADIRTVTVPDGPDPGVTFDVAEVKVAVDRDAATLSLEVRFHSPVPEKAPSSGSPHYMSFWMRDAEGDSCIGASEKVGDAYVTVDQTYGGQAGWQARYNVEFRQDYPTAEIAWSADRQALAITFTDELLRQSNHRCITGSGSGQAVYDPSRPDGGSRYDSVGPAWFDGQAPTPPPPPANPGSGAEGTAAASCADPALELTGARRVARGSTGPIEVEEALVGASTYSDVRLTMADAETGHVFYERRFTARDRRQLGRFETVDFFISLDPERRPATVRLTWSQTDYDGDVRACDASLGVLPMEGRRPAFYVRGGGVGELVPRGRRCWEVRGVPVVVTVRAGGRSATFRRRDACEVFTGVGRTIGGLRTRRTAYGTISFTALGVGRAGLTIRVGGRVVLRRSVVSRIRSRPDRRIWEGTDAFFNYCIKRNREIHSYGLRLYCIKPGSYSEAVLFR